MKNDMGKTKTTFNISKEKNFSEWYTEILTRAEITDIRYGVKGFIVIRPWGARILENMFRIYTSALVRTGHQPTFFPTVIPEENFKKESGHIEGFTPEVFWLEKQQGDEKLALRPTSETAMYQMYSLWVRSYRDLPLKMYQRANVFRLETKATRPLLRDREFHWLEAHNVFASRKEAEEQVQEDMGITDSVARQIFGIPFYPIRRPTWDTFAGAEYTIGSDSVMPDGKAIQLPSTHMLGQHFSKAFNVTYVDETEKTKYAYQTCYGPGISRMMASVIAVHGDDNGLILPYVLSPVQAVIIPHSSKESKKKIEELCQNLTMHCFNERIETEIDDSEKRPGEKFFYWEMKGVPFRIEIGEKELEKKEATVFVRDTKEKITLKLTSLVEDLKNLGAEYDARLRRRAEEEFERKIIECKTKEEVKKALDNGKIARFSYCSIDEGGKTCAEHIEKELTARVMGVREDTQEVPKGNCLFCNKKATVVVYAGKSY